MLLLFSVSVGYSVYGGQAVDATACFDLQGFIDEALAAGKKQIVIPAGTYRVTPRHGEHLVLKGLNDIEIAAEQAEMICTETTRALTISNCQNVTLRGLVIDYDPLPFTQGRIVAMPEDKRWIEFEIIDGYPENLEMRIEIYDSRTGLLKRDTYYGWRPFESLGHRRYRVTKEEGYRYHPERDSEEIGDILVTNSVTAPGGSVPHAVVCQKSKNVILSDISLFASNCFGFLETECEGTTYQQCRVNRRPLAEDITARGLRRLRSLNADAFHSKHAVKGPAILQCTAHFQGDDCVNICGDYHMVMASEGTRLRVLAKHQLNIEPGDPLELVTYEGVRLPETAAVSIRKTGSIAADELDFLSKQRMNDFFTGGGSREIYEVVLGRSVDLPRGSLIGSANRIGNGFKVVGCDFGYNRSRGILIKAGRGVVSGNRLTECREEAIKVSPEYWWLEAGSSDEVGITDNIIDRCRGMGIAVYAHAGNGAIAPAGAHKKIQIRGNQLGDIRGRDIWVTSSEELVLEDNQFKDSKPDVSLEKCSTVQIDIPAEMKDVEGVRLK
jgi:hypothetical protein